MRIGPSQAGWSRPRTRLRQTQSGVATSVHTPHHIESGDGSFAAALLPASLPHLHLPVARGGLRRVEMHSHGYEHTQVTTRKALKTISKTGTGDRCRGQVLKQTRGTQSIVPRRSEALSGLSGRRSPALGCAQHGHAIHGMWMRHACSLCKACPAQGAQERAGWVVDSRLLEEAITHLEGAPRRSESASSWSPRPSPG